LYTRQIIREKQRSVCFICEYREYNELLVILWICWRSWILLGNYATKIIDSLKKMSHQFKMCNKHVFCQRSKTRLHFFVDKLDQRPKADGFKIIEVEWKNGLNANDIPKLKLNKWHKKLTKLIIKILGLSWDLCWVVS
jgi:hypothetical protein